MRFVSAGTLVVIVVCFVDHAPAQPVAPQKPIGPPAAEIEAGFRKLCSSFQTLHARFIEVSAADFDPERGKTQANRLEAEIYLAADGRYHFEFARYRPSGDTFDRRAWDKMQAIEYRLSDGTMRISKTTTASHNFVFGFPFLLDDLFANRMNERPPRAGGTAIVNGIQCNIINVVFFSRNGSAYRYLLFLDPAIDFWPRRFTETSFADSNEPQEYRCVEYSDFVKVDGFWVPRVVRNCSRTTPRNASKSKPLDQFIYVDPLEINRNYAETRYQITPPNGTLIIDDVNRTRRIVGRNPATGISLIDPQQMQRWLWSLVGFVVLVAVATWSIWRRRRRI